MFKNVIYRQSWDHTNNLLNIIYKLTCTQWGFFKHFLYMNTRKMSLKSYCRLLSLPQHVFVTDKLLNKGKAYTWYVYRLSSKSLRFENYAYRRSGLQCSKQYCNYQYTYLLNEFYFLLCWCRILMISLSSFTKGSFDHNFVLRWSLIGEKKRVLKCIEITHLSKEKRIGEKCDYCTYEKQI